MMDDCDSDELFDRLESDIVQSNSVSRDVKNKSRGGSHEKSEQIVRAEVNTELKEEITEYKRINMRLRELLGQNKSQLEELIADFTKEKAKAASKESELVSIIKEKDLRINILENEYRQKITEKQIEYSHEQFVQKISMSYSSKNTAYSNNGQKSSSPRPDYSLRKQLFTASSPQEVDGHHSRDDTTHGGGLRPFKLDDDDVDACASRSQLACRLNAIESMMAYR